MSTRFFGLSRTRIPLALIGSGENYQNARRRTDDAVDMSPEFPGDGRNEAPRTPEVTVV